MPTGIVVLGPGPRLLRELLRAMLQQSSAFQVVEGDNVVSGMQHVVAHVAVGERERAADVAREVSLEVPVVVVSPDGRWVGRFLAGRLLDASHDATTSDLIRLVSPDA